jgi:hypothetical protein
MAKGNWRSSPLALERFSDAEKLPLAIAGLHLAFPHTKDSFSGFATDASQKLFASGKRNDHLKPCR